MKRNGLKPGFILSVLGATLGLNACDDGVLTPPECLDCEEGPGTCGGVVCLETQTCVQDVCIYNACLENGEPKVCGADEVCDSAGVCVEESCLGKTCENDMVCSKGECINADCVGVVCTDGQVCEGGQCIFEPGQEPEFITAVLDSETDENGGTGCWTLKLNRAPSADVTVTCAVMPEAQQDEANVDCSGIRVTAENFAQEQTIIVTGQPDHIVDGNQAYTIQVTAVSKDTYLNGKTFTVEMVNQDVDKAGVTVEAEEALFTSESGAQATFTLVLTSQPTADVKIPIHSSNTAYGTVEGAVETGILTVTFTPENWDKAQTVTVTGIDDGTVINDSVHMYQAILDKVESEDVHYNGLELAALNITHLDNDKAEAFANLDVVQTTENGDPVELKISLGLPPEHPVTVSVELLDEDKTSQTEVVTEAAIDGETHSLVLNRENYQEGASIRIKGLTDNQVDGPQKYMIKLSFSSEDANYNALEPMYIPGENADADTATVVASVEGGTTLTEGSEETVTVQVVLASIPTAPVTVAVSSEDDSEMIATPATLEFTPENWNVPQAVTASSVDDLWIDGHIDTKLLLKATSEDAAYEGATGEVAITVLDDDKASLIIEGNVQDLREESTEKVNFTVKLSTQPTKDVVLTLKSSDETELKLKSAQTLTWNAENWEEPQTIEVSAVDDSLKDGTQSARILLTTTSEDSHFDKLLGTSPEYQIIDNDTATVTMSIAQNALKTGEKSELSVSLSSKPTSNVVIALSGQKGFVDFDQTRLTFTPLSWNETKKVVVITKGTEADGAAIAELITAKSTGEGAYRDIDITPVPLTIYTFEDKVFNYTGSVQTVQLPAGTFKLTVHGAQGASPTAEFTGGKGAMVSGVLTLQKMTTVHVYVGGAGQTTGVGGWNGGGSAKKSAYSTLSAGGGGATDISLQAAAGDGTAWQDNAHLCSRIIVAGGGGGGLHYTNEGGTGAIGGDGGAWNGANGQKNSGTDPGYGGTLSAGGKNGALAYNATYAYAFKDSGFGFGGTQTSNNESMGAGGGGWYGGGTGTWGSMNGSGGGGSSYAWTNQISVDNQTLDAYYPASCGSTPDQAYLLTGVHAQAGVRAGNGYATIELVK